MASEVEKHENRVPISIQHGGSVNGKGSPVDRFVGQRLAAEDGDGGRRRRTTPASRRCDHPKPAPNKIRPPPRLRTGFLPLPTLSTPSSTRTRPFLTIFLAFLFCFRLGLHLPASHHGAGGTWRPEASIDPRSFSQQKKSEINFFSKTKERERK